MVGAEAPRLAAWCGAAARENFGSWELALLRQISWLSRQECGQNMVTVGKKA
jgi:hypothetical protein